jgi:hypothetical protein
MTYPTRVQEIVDALASRHPDLVHGDDEQRRQLTGLIAEQVRFELGPNWGRKRADPGRPISVDVICTQVPFVGWDIQIAGGVIAHFPDAIDLTGQVFVPVEPVDHLGVGQPQPNPEPQPVPVPQPIDLQPLLEAVAGLLAKLEQQHQEVMAKLSEPLPLPPVTFPVYRGKILGFGVTLTPDA